MKPLTADLETDKAKNSLEDFVRNFYSHYCDLDFQEQKLLLLNMNAQLKHKGKKSLRSGLAKCLTNREKEVLVLIAHGYCRREIASSLHISRNTAARHISNIYTKLDINSVAEATRVAIAHHLTVQKLEEYA